MPPQRLELTGPQLALVMAATFATTVTCIFLGLAWGILFRAMHVVGALGAVGVLALFLIAPPTIVGVILYRYFLAQNLLKVAKAQTSRPP